MTDVERSPTRRPSPLVIERMFRAPARKVFAAWTQPEQMKRWFHPDPEWVNPSIDVDLRVGGRYRVAFHNPESGDTAVVCGEFREVVCATWLVYTWVWQAPHEYEDTETIVKVEFAEVEGWDACQAPS